MTADILIVDDNAVQAATRRAVLLRSGKNVVTASSAHQALEFLDDQELSASLGMVITDHYMPGMNGLEFVDLLRRRFSHIPVLVLSGLADAESEYEEMGVFFRLKPFPPEDLILLVSSLLDEPMSRTA